MALLGKWLPWNLAIFNNIPLYHVFTSLFVNGKKCHLQVQLTVPPAIRASTNKHILCLHIYFEMDYSPWCLILLFNFVVSVYLQISALTISDLRVSAMDFAYPFFSDYFGVMYKKPDLATNVRISCYWHACFVILICWYKGCGTFPIDKCLWAKFKMV